MYCKHCGNKLALEATFCAGCGTEIDKKLEADKKAERKKALTIMVAPIIFCFASVAVWGLFGVVIAMSKQNTVVGGGLAAIISISIALSIMAFPICLIVGLAMYFHNK